MYLVVCHPAVTSWPAFATRTERASYHWEPRHAIDVPVADFWQVVQAVRYVVTLVLTAFAEVKSGDIVYTEVLGNKFLILGSTKATNDLLAERSAIYSNKSQRPMEKLQVIYYWHAPCKIWQHEISMGWTEWNLAFQTYGPSWRQMLILGHLNTDFLTYLYQSPSSDVYRALSRRCCFKI